MRRRAFTLIELLVVIGIIAVLIALLVPALSSMYGRAAKAHTQAMMSELQSALANYYDHYKAYPGPASVGTTTTVGAGKVSGAQNLLSGLVGGPDKSITNPDGTHPQLPAFFSVVVPTLSPVGVSNGKTGNVTVPTPPALPVIIDSFTDALPILYYRSTPGATLAAATNPTTPAAYYLNENVEYTGTTLVPIDATTGGPRTGGDTYDQTKGGLNGPSAVQYLSKLVTTDGTSTGVPHGGYLMISAGPDRIYGTSDDIVIVGGD